MAFLNPNYSDFKEFTGLTGKDSKYLHKNYNFFICSVYENVSTQKKYLALLMNFINITSDNKNIIYSKPNNDTTLIESADSSISSDSSIGSDNTDIGASDSASKTIFTLEKLKNKKNGTRDSSFIRHLTNH